MDTPLDEEHTAAANAMYSEEAEEETFGSTPECIFLSLLGLLTIFPLGELYETCCELGDMYCYCGEKLSALYRKCLPRWH